MGGICNLASPGELFWLNVLSYNLDISHTKIHYEER